MSIVAYLCDWTVLNLSSLELGPRGLSIFEECCVIFIV